MPTREIFSLYGSFANGLNGNGEIKEDTIPVCLGEKEADVLAMPETVISADGDAVETSSEFLLLEQRGLYFGLECATRPVVGYMTRSRFNKFVSAYDKKIKDDPAAFVLLEPSIPYEPAEILLSKENISSIFLPPDRQEKVAVKEPKENATKITKTKVTKKVEKKKVQETQVVVKEDVKKEGPPIEAVSKASPKPLEEKKRKFTEEIAESMPIDNEGSKELYSKMAGAASKKEAQEIFEQWSSIDEKSALKRNLKTNIVGGDEKDATAVLDSLDYLPEDAARDVLRSAIYHSEEIESPHVRAELVKKMAKLGNYDDVIRLVDQVLKETDESVIAAGLEALEWLPYRIDWRNVPASAIIGVVGQLRARLGEIQKKMAKLTKSKDSELRQKAYIGLGMFKARGGDVDGIIQEGLKDKEPDVRIAATIAASAKEMDGMLDYKKLEEVWYKYKDYLHILYAYQNREKTGIVYSNAPDYNYVITDGKHLQEQRVKYSDYIGALLGGYDQMSEEDKLKAIERLKALAIYTWDFAEKIMKDLPNVSPALQKAYIDFLEYNAVAMHHAQIFISNRKILEDLYAKTTDEDSRHKIGVFLFAAGDDRYLTDFLKYYGDNWPFNQRVDSYFYAVISRLPKELIKPIINNNVSSKDPKTAMGAFRMIYRLGLKDDRDIVANLLSSKNDALIKEALGDFYWPGILTYWDRDDGLKGREGKIKDALVNLIDHKDPQISETALIMYAEYYKDPAVLPRLFQKLSGEEGDERIRYVDLITGIAMKLDKEDVQHRQAITRLINAWLADDPADGKFIEAARYLNFEDRVMGKIMEVAKKTEHPFTKQTALNILRSRLHEPEIRKMFIDGLNDKSDKIKLLTAEALFYYEKNVEAVEVIASLVENFKLNWAELSYALYIIKEANIPEINERINNVAPKLAKSAVKEIAEEKKRYNIDRHAINVAKDAFNIININKPADILGIIQYLQQIKGYAKTDEAREWIKTWEEKLKGARAGDPVNKYMQDDAVSRL